MTTAIFWMILGMGALTLLAIWHSTTPPPDDELDEHAQYPGETRRPA